MLTRKIKKREISSA